MICSCYKTEKERRYIPISRNGYLTNEYNSVMIDVGRCWGTREKDICGCRGNQLYCDFYKDVREKAQKELSDKAKEIIIRCKECKVPHDRFTGCSKLNGFVTAPEFYCGFAE